MPYSPAQKFNVPVRQQRIMVGLCMLLIALQFADAISTYLALNTGRTVEKNELLINFAEILDWPVFGVVIVAKLVVAAFFGLAMTRTKPSPVVLGLLVVLAAYVSLVVGMNFYWAWALSM